MKNVVVGIGYKLDAVDMACLNAISQHDANARAGEDRTLFELRKRIFHRLIDWMKEVEELALEFGYTPERAGIHTRLSEDVGLSYGYHFRMYVGDDLDPDL